jgi:hypothetical protein
MIWSAVVLVLVPAMESGMSCAWPDSHQGGRTRLPVLRTRHDRGLHRGQRPHVSRHAVAALNGIVGAQVDWPDSKGLSEWERKALELAEERSQLG